MPGALDEDYLEILSESRADHHSRPAVRRIGEAVAVTPQERLEQAWVQAGYPKEYLPKQQIVKVAEAVFSAYQAGAEDFLKAGWQAAKVDFPFAVSHPRYQAMLVAYRELGQ